jgi:tetratricopeptide (TPR) repeat protein
LGVLKPLLHTGICALFFLIAFPMRADDPEKGNPAIDSLLNVIGQHPADSNGAKAYIGLAGEYLFEDPHRAEKYCKESLRIARAARWDTGIGEALGWLAYLMEQRGKPDSALVYYQEALALSRKTNSPKGEGVIAPETRRFLFSR